MLKDGLKKGDTVIVVNTSSLISSETMLFVSERKIESLGDKKVKFENSSTQDTESVFITIDEVKKHNLIGMVAVKDMDEAKEVFEHFKDVLKRTIANVEKRVEDSSDKDFKSRTNRNKELLERLKQEPLMILSDSLKNEEPKEENLIGLKTGIITNSKDSITITFEKTIDILNIGDSFYWYSSGRASVIEIVDIQIAMNKNTFMILYVDEDNNKYNSRDSFMNLEELKDELGDIFEID